MESEGLCPIPVYHPLGDGWDYLDELLDEYDRVCIGNLARSVPEVRTELLHTVWELVRRAKHRVWVHALGVTPMPCLLSAPIQSADSTAHAYMMKFGASVCTARAMTAPFAKLDQLYYSYTLGEAENEIRGRGKASEFAGFLGRADLVCWRRVWEDAEREVGT